MRRAFLPALSILLCAKLVFAQAGALCVYDDQAGLDCHLEGNTSGLVTYHIVHTLTPGATAIQFSAPKPFCMSGAFWVSDTQVWPVTIGDSQSGVSVAYGGCQTGPILVLSMIYQVDSTIPLNCLYPILADIDGGQDYVRVVDCAADVSSIIGGRSFFDPAVMRTSLSALKGFSI